MTARASRSGVKREARSPKATARERLVAYYREGVGCMEPRCGACKHFAKLLRAHERELAERAMHEFDVRFDGRPFISGAKLKAAVRAAILGPPSAGPRKGGKS